MQCGSRIKDIVKSFESRCECCFIIENNASSVAQCKGIIIHYCFYLIQGSFTGSLCTKFNYEITVLTHMFIQYSLFCVLREESRLPTGSLSYVTNFGGLFFFTCSSPMAIMVGKRKKKKNIFLFFNFFDWSTQLITESRALTFDICFYTLLCESNNVIFS
mgnify:CR=1 FL=1